MLDDAAFRLLRARQRDGFALAREFYGDPAIFERERQRIFARQWLFAGHVSLIPEPGDYFLHRIGGESVIVCRDNDGAVRAFFNVCRHRGSRICLEASGTVASFVCPYHAWAYGLDGALNAARQMPDDFERADYGLYKCHVGVAEGLIFLNLDEDPSVDFAAIGAEVAAVTRPHRFDSARVAARRNYPVEANWKLVIENFNECYHCPSAHPEYRQVNAYVRAVGDGRPEQVRVFEEMDAAWRQRTEAMGHRVDCAVLPPELPDQFHLAYRQVIQTGFDSLTEDGRPAAPLMGELSAFDGGETVVHVGPFFSLSAANDYACLISFEPQDVSTTNMTLTWLVDREAREGEDLDTERMCWMWDVTTRQDQVLIENNQRGLESIRYSPGPYSVLESFTRQFVDWYLRQMR